MKHYPAVRASLERSSAAQAGVGLARTTYLPRADTVWQTNRATDNNITGLLLPQSIIAPISGPVPPSTSGRSAWGSAAGLLFSWEPLDFGYRGAKVDAARAVRDQAVAETSLTRLDVAVATVNAYLTVLAAERTVHAAEADVQRRETFSKAVRVLTDNQLRAGADASRAAAEWARARVNLARARQQEQVSRANFADILGMPDTSVDVREDSLHEPPPDTSLESTDARRTSRRGSRARSRCGSTRAGPCPRPGVLSETLFAILGIWARQWYRPGGKFSRRLEWSGSGSRQLGRRFKRDLSHIRHLYDPIEKGN